MTSTTSPYWTMALPGEIRQVATFIERPNRFIGVVDLNGEVVRAHIADPGRLRELLLPGAEVMVRHDPNPNRKLPYSLDLVKAPTGFWVSINSQLPNRIVGHSFTDPTLRLPGLEHLNLVCREVTVGHSRFDFLLEHTTPKNKNTKPILVEVKGVSLVVDNQLAMFPDAPTVRGARHVNELADLQTTGDYDTMVLFIIQRTDVTLFTPFHDRDPDFSNALTRAHNAGTKVLAYSFALHPQHATFHQPIPLQLHPLS